MNLRYLFARLLGYFISVWALVVFAVMIKTLQIQFDTIHNFLFIPLSIAICAFIFAIGQLLLIIRQVRLLVEAHSLTIQPKTSNQFWLDVMTGTLLTLSGCLITFCIYRLIEALHFEVFNSFLFEVFNSFLFGIIGFGMTLSARMVYPIGNYFETYYYQVVPIREKDDEIELPRFDLMQIIIILGGMMLMCCAIPIVLVIVNHPSRLALHEIMWLLMGLTGILSIIVWGQVLHFLVQSDLAIALIAEAQQKPFPPQSQSTKWAKTVQLGYRLVMASCLIPLIINAFLWASYNSIQQNPDYLTVVFLLLPSAILFAIYTVFMSMGRMLRLAIHLQASFDDFPATEI